MPPDGPESWPTHNSKKQWLVFYRINGMSMEGGGLIDGKGEKWWDLPCKPHKVIFYHLPFTFNILTCNIPFSDYLMQLQGVNRTTIPGPCDSPVVSPHHYVYLHKHIYIYMYAFKDPNKNINLLYESFIFRL